MDSINEQNVKTDGTVGGLEKTLDPQIIVKVFLKHHEADNVIREALIAVLNDNYNGNVTKFARGEGISRASAYRILNEYGIGKVAPKYQY